MFDTTQLAAFSTGVMRPPRGRRRSGVRGVDPIAKREAGIAGLPLDVVLALTGVGGMTCTPVFLYSAKANSAQGGVWQSLHMASDGMLMRLLVGLLAATCLLPGPWTFRSPR